MSLQSMELTQEALSNLIAKGLEKDIAKFVSDKLIAIHKAEIEVAIKDHVQAVVSTYMKSMVAVQQDMATGELIVKIILVQKP